MRMAIVQMKKERDRMDVREKLIELLKTNACPSSCMCDPACRYYGFGNCFPYRFADHLITNGVTVQRVTDNDVGGNWIPVTERLPEEEGLYLVAVVNNHERRYSKTAWYHGHGNWFLHQKVTHWMLLPAPPNGE